MVTFKHIFDLEPLVQRLKSALKPYTDSFKSLDIDPLAEYKIGAEEEPPKPKEEGHLEIPSLRDFQAELSEAKLQEFYSDPELLEYMLFQRAKLEPLLLKTMSIPRANKDYISPVNEKQFMRMLMSSTCDNRDDLVCQYISFKIFHFIQLCHSIQMKTFSLYFGLNSNQDIVLKDAKIYDLELLNLDLGLL